MAKRWTVDVWFRSPMFPDDRLIETKTFTLWLSAWLFARSKDQWSGWKQTWAEIRPNRPEAPTPGGK